VEKDSSISASTF